MRVNPLLPLIFPVQRGVDGQEKQGSSAKPNSSKQGITKKTAAKRTVKKRSSSTDPNLYAIWLTLIAEFFPERADLAEYTVSWSGRPQKRTLASCNLRRRKISVAKEMRHPEGEEFLPALLYHEMCHAALGHNVAQKNSRRSWHGREFRELEARHPKSEALRLWIQKGGWGRAVRSTRMKDYHERKRKG